MNTTMAITERELEFVELIRKHRRELHALPQDSSQQEKDEILHKLKEAVEGLEKERRNIRVRKMAVDMINTPGIDLKTYRAFGTITVFLLVALAVWLYVSGDMQAHSLPSQMLFGASFFSGLIYYLGYICPTRK